MKPMQVFLAGIISIAAVGCYNLLIVNAGVANKSAATLGAPLDPETACQALANQGFTISKLITDVKSDDSLSLCKDILIEQQKKATKAAAKKETKK